MTSVYRRPFEALSEVDGRYQAAAFFLGLGAYVLMQVVTALGYRPDVRLFPLVIGIPLLVLIAAKVVFLLAGDRLGFDVVDLFEDVTQMEFEEMQEVPTDVRYGREFAMVVWTAVLLVLIWLLGILPAIAVFIFTFIYFYQRDVARALGATLLAYAFVYVLFIEILGAVLYQGQFTFEIAGVAF